MCSEISDATLNLIHMKLLFWLNYMKNKSLVLWFSIPSAGGATEQAKSWNEHAFFFDWTSRALVL